MSSFSDLYLFYKDMCLSSYVWWIVFFFMCLFLDNMCFLLSHCSVLAANLPLAFLSSWFCLFLVELSSPDSGMSVSYSPECWKCVCLYASVCHEMWLSVCVCLWYNIPRFLILWHLTAPIAGNWPRPPSVFQYRPCQASAACNQDVLKYFKIFQEMRWWFQKASAGCNQDIFKKGERWCQGTIRNISWPPK